MSEWLTIDEAPLNTLGLVWSADGSWGGRTDICGQIMQYDSGQRVAVGSFNGFKITHWHPLPSPPSVGR